MNGQLVKIGVSPRKPVARAIFNQDGELVARLVSLTVQPQNEYIELHQKRYGKRLDHEERKFEFPDAGLTRKAQEGSSSSPRGRILCEEDPWSSVRILFDLNGGLCISAKLFNKKRHAEKIQMKKT